MLQAQVNYWNLVEQKRHNLAGEELTRGQLVESIRHSMTTESIEKERIAEIKRHDLASETLESIRNTANMISARAAASQASTAALRAGYDYELGLGNLSVRQGELEVSQYDAANKQQSLMLQEQETDIHRYDAQTRRGNLYNNIAGTVIDGLSKAAAFAAR